MWFENINKFEKQQYNLATTYVFLDLIVRITMAA